MDNSRGGVAITALDQPSQGVALVISSLAGVLQECQFLFFESYPPLIHHLSTTYPPPWLITRIRPSSKGILILHMQCGYLLIILVTFFRYAKYRLDDMLE